LLLKAIVNHDHSAEVAASCIQALVTLSSMDSNIRKLKSSNACSVFVR